MTGSPSGGAGGKLVIQTRIDSRRFYILVPVRVADNLIVDFVLDTGAPLTSMSQRLYTRLQAAGYLSHIATNRYILSPASIAGENVAPLNIRGSKFLASVGVDGVLGLDFLARYTEVHFNVRTRLLTLTP